MKNLQLVSAPGLLLAGCLCGFAASEISAQPRRNCCVVNFDNDTGGAAEGGLSEFVLTVNGVPFRGFFAAGEADDSIREAIWFPVSNQPQFDAHRVGDTTLVILGSAGSPAIASCEVDEDDVSLVVEARIVERNAVCVFDVDPADPDGSLDAETPVGEPGSPGGTKVSISCSKAASSGQVALLTGDTDLDARNRLFDALPAALPGAVKVGNTAIILPGEATDVDDQDPVLQVAGNGIVKAIPSLSKSAQLVLIGTLALLALVILRKGLR